jgi:DNA polymerase delta subunit 2
MLQKFLRGEFPD